MSIDPQERVRLGRSAVSVTRLGFGAAPISGLYQAFTDEAGAATVGRAWDLGIRYFDAAPLYGYGLGERRLGLGLAGRPRDAFVVSTKVGRLLIREDRITADMDRDWQRNGDRPDAYYGDIGTERPVFDYSSDAIRRSVEDSLGRIGLDRVDILYVHDPDNHMEAALRDAWPALARLREEGTVGAIGFGMNDADKLAWFTERTDPDVLMVAGRYTILDQAALPELLPLCERKGVSVVIAGVMNSGMMADPKPGATFNYATADAAWVERAQRIRDVCLRHGVNQRAAAVQFVFAHPTVASLVAGVRSIPHLDEYPVLMETPIPADLWAELRAEGLLDPAAPVPSGA